MNDLTRLGCRLLFILLACVSSSKLQAQKGEESSNYWQDIPASSTAGIKRYSWPDSYRLIKIDDTTLTTLFRSVPNETFPLIPGSGMPFTIPLPEGGMMRFRVSETKVMDSSLARQFPSIHTYSGNGIENPTATVRISITELGFQVMIRDGERSIFIDPVQTFPLNGMYLIYDQKNLKAYRNFFCDAEGAGAPAKASLPNQSALRTTGTQLRTYRLALACTGEYAAVFGGTKSGALSAMVASINRVDGVYESELAIRLVLIPNDTLLIYTNSTTDPYTNGNGSTMLGENQTNIDNVIGNLNYDIGHVFSTGGGGIAGLGVVCRTSNKARGVTGSGSPVGDSYDIDYVAHEMGHQFNANHTFNSVTGSCGGGNRSAIAAFEPGSGITIMAYAGICGADDLAAHSIAYFHTYSYDEITLYTTTGLGSGCPVTTTTGNNPPTNSPGTLSWTIPYLTPFQLTGSATDPNGDAVTYSWEEFDKVATGNSLTAPAGDAPIFRPFSPVTTGTRVFPKLSDILNNVTTPGELLPSYARNLKFKLTVRDNRSGGGGVNNGIDTVKISVINTGSAFSVTSPNTTLTWLTGSTQNITWNVASTSSAPISCTAVKISLSTDGGLTFPILLASNTPNDGSESITVPSNLTTTARVKIEAAGNIFFDISNSNFTIQVSNPVLTSLNCSTTTLAFCAGDNLVASYSGDGPANAGNIFSVQLSGSTGSFATPAVIGTLSSTSPSGSISCTIPSSVAGGSGYRIRVVSSNPVVTGNNNGSNISISYVPPAVISPAGNVTACSTGVALSFTSQPGFGYQWYKDNILISGQTNSTFTATQSGSYSVSTSQLLPHTFTNTNVVNILDNNCASPAISTIAVSGFNSSIQSSKIYIRLNISHTWVGDVSIILQAPGGELLGICNRTGNVNNSGDNFTNTVLADSGVNTLTTSSAPYTGLYKPLPSVFTSCITTTITSFAAIGGGSLNPNGNWQLRVYDQATGDVGTIDNWSITFPPSPGGCTANSNIVNVTILPPPVLNNFSPSSGTSGTVITINGSDLNTTSSVKINGVAASFSVISNSQVSATVPATATTGLIDVTTFCGTAQSATAFTVNSNTLLNLKIYLQGFYINGGSMVSVLGGGLADSVTVELHQAISPYTLVYSVKSVIDTNGNGSFIFPASAAGNNYYLVIRHRNTMETWSKNPVTLGSVTTYNFTN